MLQQEGNTLCFQLLLKHSADLQIGGTSNVIQHFNNRDLGAHGRIISRHLQADDAAADDTELCGDLGQVQHLPVGHHKIAQIFLYAGNRRYCRGRAGGDDELFAGVCNTCSADGKALRSLTGDRGLLHHHGDTVGAHLCLHAGNQSADHLVLSCHHFLLVDGHIVTGNTVRTCVEGVFIVFCAVEQRFGGNAALVQTNAAQGPLFKQQRSQPCLCAPLCSQIAAGAAADDDQIKNFHKNSSLLTQSLAKHRGNEQGHAAANEGGK